MTPALLTTPIVLTVHDCLSATATIEIDPADPMFAGHYPGEPVVPGVYLIDCVHQVARRTAPSSSNAVSEPNVNEPDVIESARFLTPVLPGDGVTIDLRWSPEADGWRCAATVAVAGRGRAATVRLHYPPAGAPT